jgi:hypothetical protein
MSISFSNTLPEVFEYPSYEAPVPIPNSNTSAPLKSNAIGSFGKLKRFDFNFLFSVQITKLLVGLFAIGLSKLLSFVFSHSPYLTFLLLKKYIIP